MFFHKKRKPVPTLRLFDSAGKPILSVPVADYVMPEETVLALSVEYFDDPEPCEIHRGAVHKRAMMELIGRCGGSGLAVSELSEGQRRYFPAETARVLITEELS